MLNLHHVKICTFFLPEPVCLCQVAFTRIVVRLVLPHLLTLLGIEAIEAWDSRRDDPRPSPPWLSERRHDLFSMSIFLMLRIPSRRVHGHIVKTAEVRKPNPHPESQNPGVAKFLVARENRTESEFWQWVRRVWITLLGWSVRLREILDPSGNVCVTAFSTTSEKHRKTAAGWFSFSASSRSKCRDGRMGHSHNLL